MFYRFSWLRCCWILDLLIEHATNYFLAIAQSVLLFLIAYFFKKYQRGILWTAALILFIGTSLMLVLGVIKIVDNGVANHVAVFSVILSLPRSPNMVRLGLHLPVKLWPWNRNWWGIPSISGCLPDDIPKPHKLRRWRYRIWGISAAHLSDEVDQIPFVSFQVC